MLDTNIISKYTKYTLQYNNMNSSYTKMFRDAFKKQWQKQWHHTKNVGRGQFKIILEVSRKNDETLKKGGVKML